MSIEAMSCAWHHSKHTGGELMVLLAVSDNANDEMICWPSRRYIAKKCRMSERNVQRCIQNLVASGELILMSVGTGRVSSRYRVNLAQMRQFAAAEIEGRRIVSGDAGVSAGEADLSPKPSIEPSLLLKEEELIHDWQHLDDIALSIYNNYPLRCHKPKALASILKQIKSVSAGHQRSHAAMILEKTKAFAAVMGSDLDFCPNPTTWFNQQRFNDDPSTWKRKNGTNQQNTNPSSRTVGTANEGRAADYANAGKVR